MQHRHLTILLLSALLGGCAATPATVATRGSGSEFESLARQQQRLALQLERTQDNLLLVEARMEDQQRLIAELQQQVSTLSGSGAGENPASFVPSAAPDQTSTPVPFVSPTLAPTDVYRQAFADYAAGSYSQAIGGFASFLRLFPENPYAGNAQYWLGECHYAQQQYPRAIDEFEKVIQRFPDADKAPNALYRMAAALRAIGQEQRAAQALATLQERYPQSSAAARARQQQ